MVNELFLSYIKLFLIGVSFLLGILLLVILFLCIDYDELSKPNSIKEYERYSKIIGNGNTLTVRTNVGSAAYNGTITIHNKQGLIEYINSRYNTDVLKELEKYNKKQ